MAESLQLKVVTPKGSLLDEEVASFTVASDLGEFCVLPNHRPILAALVVSRMVVEQLNGGKIAYALDNGFLEGGADHVSVITERCVPAEELDQAALGKEVGQLEEELNNMDSGAPEAQDTIKALEWAKVRLDVSEMSNG